MNRQQPGNFEAKPEPREPDLWPAMREKAQKVLKEVSEVSSISVEDMKGDARNPQIVAARVLYTEICRHEYITDAVTAEVINKDRTTVVHYCNRYKPSEFYKVIKTNYLQWKQ